MFESPKSGNSAEKPVDTQEAIIEVPAEEPGSRENFAIGSNEHLSVVDRLKGEITMSAMGLMGGTWALTTMHEAMVRSGGVVESLTSGDPGYAFYSLVGLVMTGGALLKLRKALDAIKEKPTHG